MAKWRVLIADDHPIVLAGLRATLQADGQLQVVGELTDGRTVLERINALRPQVLVLDISMPHVDGIELVSLVKQQYPDTRIVIHSVHQSLQKVHDCLERGAEAYVVKGDLYADMLTAVRSVLDGHYYLSPSISRALVERYLAQTHTRPVADNSVETLTPRERDIIRLTAQGLPSREIAKRLGLKPKTVDNCRYRLRQKLALPSASALVSYAVEYGLVDFTKSHT